MGTRGKRVLRVIGFLICWALSDFLHAEQKDDFNDSGRFYHWYLDGTKLTSGQVEAFQKRLAKDPEDAQARIEMMSYWNSSKEVYSESKTRDQLKENLIWVIQNHPDSLAAGQNSFDASFSIRSIHPKDYDEFKDLWLRQVQKHPKNTAILGNASNFFMFEDKKRSETLLKEAMKLEPKNPKWPDALAHLSALSMIGKKSEKDAGSKALAQEEKAASLEKNEIDRFYKLADLAKYAFEAGKDGKAEAYSKELLALAPKYKTDWNYGNALFYGNHCLGRLALKKGDLDAACQYLIEAGKTPGSPQLNSFGPSMVLAKDLLEKGKKEAVLTFLKSCRSFWKMGKDRLKEWIASIERGETPQFDNLYL